VRRKAPALVLFAAELLLASLLFLSQIAFAQPAPPEPLRRELARLVRSGGVAVALDGGLEWAYQPGMYVPASILKLATALAAFDLFGPDYRFRTNIFRDSAGHLYLRGFGDPHLVSEEWRAIAEALDTRGAFAGPIRDVVVDDSAFAEMPEVDGREDSLNPYDARLGALVSNFNTVQVAVARDGSVAPGEPQTPLTPLALELARGLPPGLQRINLSRRPEHGARYSGELARAIFRQAGARIEGRVRAGRVPPDAALLLAHRSRHTLRDVVAGMMEFSNNFMANQLLLVMALERHGPPVRLEQGVALLREYLTARLGLAPEDFALTEGSGLSPNNRIDLVAMLRITDAFHPWAGLLQPYGRPPYQVPAKTGSLADVSTLAGFLPAPPGSRRTFVIILNQERNTRDAVFGELMKVYAPD
jgi:D-alanyl-D-alanine carboxypeptidase/D-alanyl-D-alanine-endopeptidase (penicillin-binding protein 4)